MSKANFPPGVSTRGNMYWWEKRHRRLPGGRIRKTLMVPTDHPKALELVRQRVAAIQLCMDRGEWGAIERWATGDLDVTDLVRVVMQGDWSSFSDATREAPTLREEFRRFLGHVQRKKAARTWDQYRSILGNVERALGPTTRLDAVTVEDADAFLFGPQESNGGRPWSRNSIRAVRALCVQVWKHAIGREGRRVQREGGKPSVTFNPWAEVKAPKKPRSRAITLTRPQWLELLEAIRGTPYALWMGCAFLAGLRKMEAARLRHIHFDREKGVIHVPGTKTDNALRSVPIPKLLWALYDEHVELGLTGREWIFVVPGSPGHLSRTTAGAWAAESYRMGGYKPGRRGDGLTYHSGRHSYATWLAQDNVSPAIGAMLIGDTVEVYVKTYVHLKAEDLEFAVEGLQRSLNEAHTTLDH